MGRPLVLGKTFSSSSVLEHSFLEDNSPCFKILQCALGVKAVAATSSCGPVKGCVAGALWWPLRSVAKGEEKSFEVQCNIPGTTEIASLQGGKVLG